MAACNVLELKWSCLKSQDTFHRSLEMVALLFLWSWARAVATFESVKIPVYNDYAQLHHLQCFFLPQCIYIYCSTSRRAAVLPVMMRSWQNIVVRTIPKNFNLDRHWHFFEEGITSLSTYIGIRQRVAMYCEQQHYHSSTSQCWTSCSIAEMYIDARLTPAVTNEIETRIVENVWCLAKRNILIDILIDMNERTDR